MSIKLVEKSAIPAWSPIASAKSLLAFGGSAPGGGSEFSSGSQLELYSLDASGRGNGMNAIASAHVDSQFRSIGWADIGPACPLGVIAGGLNDGVVALWDAAKMVNKNQPSSSPSRASGALLFTQDSHSGRAVSCLEFNPQKASLLGTGGCDGQVQVINVERPSQPDFFRGVTTTKHMNTEVVCLSWNRKVQHILATASNQGLTVVWDLKSKKEVITIKDPANRTRCSALSWNPDVPTQLLVAYNDDSNPCIQLWDMRNCSYPFREFQEHSRGVTCASFCDLDSNLLVSSGRDNRSVCWSLHSGQLEAYSDLGLSAPATKLEWSQHLPGFIAASAASGTVSIHSIAQKQTPVAARFPPKWTKMPCGVAFGFGGKLVTFGSLQASRIQLHVVPDEPAVVNEADRFEQFLATDLRPFCASKVHESQDEHERLTWTLMSILFEGPSSRAQVVAALGIDSAEIQALSEKYLGRQAAAAAVPQVTATPSQDATFEHMHQFGDASNLDPDQLDNLFDQLAKNSEQQQVVGISSAANSRRGTPRAANADADDHLPVTDWSQGPEAIIKQSILVGDIATAVECCMKCGRYADALFLAAGGGDDLWKRTREEYSKKQKDPFIKLVGFVLSNDMEKFVSQSDLSTWVETLAILVTYARGDAYGKLVEMLGDRLEKERFDIRAAVLCYLACGSFENTVRIWASMSNTQGSQSQALQGLVEKMSCLFSAVRPATADPIFSHKVLQYAALLANSGRILAAMRCLILVPDSTETRILKDRIYNAAPSMMGHLVRGPPPFPFEVSDIRPAPAPMAPQQHQQPAYGGAPAANRYQHLGQQQTGPAPPPQYHAAVTPTASAGIPSRGLQAPPPMANQPPAYGNPPPQATFNAHPPPSGPASLHGRAPMNAPPAAYHQQTAPPQGARPSTPGSSPTNFATRTQLPPHPVSGPPSMQSPSPANIARPLSTPSAIPVRPQPTQGFPGMQAPPVGGPMGFSSHSQSPAQSYAAPPSQAPPQRVLPSHPSPAPQQAAPGWGAPSMVSPPVMPPSGQNQPTMPPRPVVGPPSSGGVSTAPHATANPVTPGMPVSWPVPTPVQQQLSPGVAPPPRASAPPVVMGEAVPPHEIAVIQRALGGLLDRCAQDGNRKKWEDTGKKLNELYDKLATGQISRESVAKIKDLCACVERGDFGNASRLRVELSASDWERNRTWLFAVQLLLPK